MHLFNSDVVKSPFSGQCPIFATVFYLLTGLITTITLSLRRTLVRSVILFDNRETSDVNREINYNHD